MDPAALVPLGRIVKRHGLAGEVSVFLARDVALEGLVDARVWFVPPPLSVRSAQISAVRQGPKGPLVKFTGVEDPDAAEKLRGTTVMIERAALTEADEASSDVVDPIGLRIEDVEKGELGTVTDLIVTGANDVWVVDGGAFGQVLIPVIDDVVETVDWQQRTARVRLLPGLIEEA